MSLRLALLSAALRLGVKPVLRFAPRPEANDHVLRAGARLFFRAPPFALYLDGALGPVRCLRISARPGSRATAPRKLIFYVHGGGFISGAPETHKAMLARLSWITGVEVCAPAYRLAPAHPFPAAVKDVRAAWDGVMAWGYRPEDVVIAGDSAGGALGLGLLAALLAEGVRPAGYVGLAPMADFTFSGASITENARREAMLPAARRGEVQDWYLAGADPTDPRASPLFADFDHPPPALIQVSDSEILRDDGLRIAKRLEEAGGDVTLSLWPKAPHVFQIFDGWVPEARAALREVGAFVMARLEQAERA